jgi:YfiR/HmsC-like
MVRSRRVGWLVLFVTLATGLAPGSGRAEEVAPSEYQVKAVYLFNFARFVEWADLSSAPSAGPFVICVLGKDPFGAALDDALSGEVIAGRRLVARRIPEPKDAGDCRILFAGASEAGRYAAIVAALKGRSVLTVGDDESFVQRGGMVGFRLERGTVRLDVNPEALRAAGLTMSSQLLRLARIVSTQP